MTFECFDKCMILIRAWRSRHNMPDNSWPDSRDPVIVETLLEFGVTSQELEKSMVALAAWREAKEDVYQTTSTLLQVIKNRQLKGDFRGHLSDKQFPTMSEENLDYNTYPGKTDNFSKILENLDMILENKVVDLTQGAIYFGAVQHHPAWLRELISSGKAIRTTQAGRLTFYKEP